MSSFFKLVVFCFFLTATPGIIQASSVVRSGEAVSIAAEQEVMGDFYGLGGTVAVSGKVAEDLLLLGGTVTLNGEVEGDIAVVGGSVDFHGTSKDDVRIVGGTVIIAGEITGNLVVVASELKVLSTATIGGDILFFGGKAEISGEVGKDILGTSNQLRVDAVVKGGLDVTTSSLTLGERTKIAEDVSYTSNQEIVRAQNAEVGGQVARSDGEVVVVNSYRVILVPFFISLFASLVWFLLFKAFTERVVLEVKQNRVRNLLVGFAIVFLTPLVSIVLLASTLGSIIGLISLTLYFSGIFISLCLMGIVAGSYLGSAFSKAKSVTVLHVVLGVLVIHVLLHIPVIGPIIIFSLFLVTLGSLAEKLYLSLRQ